MLSVNVVEKFAGAYMATITLPIPTYRIKKKRGEFRVETEELFHNIGDIQAIGPMWYVDSSRGITYCTLSAQIDPKSADSAIIAIMKKLRDFAQSRILDEDVAFDATGLRMLRLFQ